MNAAPLMLEPAPAGRSRPSPGDEALMTDLWTEADDGPNDIDSPQDKSPSTRQPRGPVVVEADQIILKAGDAMLILNRANGGTLEIRAPRVVIHGDDVTSEAEHTNTLAGHSVVTEAVVHADVLGKLIRINGQCVKINC